MKPEEFIKTVYLGDRACKKIELDGWNNVVKIQVNEISRVRDPSGQWNYYNEENITDGYLVFENVSSFTMNPQGYLPNDWIEIASLTEYENMFEIIFSVGYMGVDVASKEIELTIRAQQIYLEDPKRPGIKICE